MRRNDVSVVLRRLRKGIGNLPNLLQGYNVHVNRDKLSLIDLTFRELYPQARSFADLGGVWRVNAAYTLHTLKKLSIDRGVIVDTDFPPAVISKLNRYRNLEVVQGDFGERSVMDRIGRVDVVYLFDVLLHQANPDWDQILERYSRICTCLVIHNPQLIRGEEVVRLTDLPPEEYFKLASSYRNLYQYVYAHREEIHPIYRKPWKDIHNITQWGITDRALRATMTHLGYDEVFFRNYGMFASLPAFENHAFVFSRRARPGKTDSSPTGGPD